MKSEYANVSGPEGMFKKNRFENLEDNLMSICGNLLGSTY